MFAVCLNSHPKVADTMKLLVVLILIQVLGGLDDARAQEITVGKDHHPS